MVTKNPSKFKGVTSKFFQSLFIKTILTNPYKFPLKKNTLPYNSTKQLISTYPITHKVKYQRPYSDAPLRNSVLGTLLTQQHTQKGCLVHNSSGCSFVCGKPALSCRHCSFSDKYTAKFCAILHSPSDPAVLSRCAKSPFVDFSSSDSSRNFAECVQSGKLVAFCCVPWPHGGARQSLRLWTYVTSRRQNKFVTQ
jgi:hypothetical protein